MDNLTDLKAIWMSADTNALPDAAGMLHIVRKHRIEKLRKTTKLILMALASLILTAVALFYYRPVMVTTRVSFACMILAACILVATNLTTLFRFYRLGDCSNKEFISFTEHTRKRQLFYYRYTQVVGLMLSSVGLLLYPYEAVHESRWLTIVAYAIAAVFLAVLWFVIRPRNFRRESQKITEILNRLNSISKQF